MKRLLLLLLPLACLSPSDVSAHHPKGVTYKVYQFPPNKLPRIDGDPTDWEIVPDSLTIDGSHLMDTVMGKGQTWTPRTLPSK